MFTNIGLTNHALRAYDEKWKYVWATIGKKLTNQIVLDVQQRYPDNINKYLSLIKTFLGQRTCDCVNLIKSYLWWNKEKDDPVYDIKYDKVNGVWMSADGAFQVAKEKGNINTIPEIKGVCVYYKGHIGVYIGNGEVIEARGTKYGVVKTKLKDRAWTHWLKYPDIVYLEDDNMFNDIQGHYAEKYIKAIEKTGLMVGDGKGKFNPDSLITRGQLAVVLAKLLHLPIEE
mgnify:CR=1 FL=1